MTDNLPDGTAIGEMQAPLRWIFSHTTRFSGVVRIRMQDGEGFMLVRKGEPLAAQFMHPLKSLSGPAALKYFGSQPILDFGLYRYEPGEMQAALAVSAEMQALLQPGNGSPVTGQSAENDGQEDVVAETVENERQEDTGAGAAEHEVAASSGDEPDPFGALLRHPGVTAVACFADGLCTSSVGKIDADYTVAIAEDLLRWAFRLESIAPSHGEFVQMTIFYRDGNIIVAPYGNEYLCIITRPEVQFGRIRRMIREMQGRV
ncbi:MAG: roadblock/LC7 domain-containing protein [Methanomicrobiales archaeon]|nr:roadblock/LC7 domain-containing protein [Methanomicrobiales archaeon]